MNSLYPDRCSCGYLSNSMGRADTLCYFGAASSTQNLNFSGMGRCGGAKVAPSLSAHTFHGQPAITLSTWKIQMLVIYILSISCYSIKDSIRGFPLYQWTVNPNIDKFKCKSNVLIFFRIQYVNENLMIPLTYKYQLTLLYNLKGAIIGVLQLQYQRTYRSTSLLYTISF